MVDPASGSRPRTRQDSLISLPFSAFLLFILVMGRPNSNTNSSRCPNFSLTLRHPACYDLPRAVLIGRSPRQSRCLSSNLRRPRFVVGDVEASGKRVAKLTAPLARANLAGTTQPNGCTVLEFHCIVVRFDCTVLLECMRTCLGAHERA